MRLMKTGTLTAKFKKAGLKKYDSKWRRYDEGRQGFDKSERRKRKGEFLGRERYEMCETE